MKTVLCERLGIGLPIIQAPMGGAVGPSLAAAVCNAGGLGMLVLWRADAETMRRQIREIVFDLARRQPGAAGKMRAKPHDRNFLPFKGRLNRQ